MSTKEENELLTQTSLGTPGGNFLRRYWWPIAISEHLKDKPTLIRLLSENLVLFRNGSGDLGLVAAACSHRRANLCFGYSDGAGLRCRYHGWKYGIDGKILDIPGEPRESKLKESINHQAYRVEESHGLILAYLGPEPVPLLPRYDFVVGEGERRINITGFSRCNWLQCVENGMDPVHVSFAHNDVLANLTDLPEMFFSQNEYGLIHKTFRPGSDQGTYFYREHHVAMPGISIGGGAQRRVEGGSGPGAKQARWSVPIDDTNTMMLTVVYKPRENTGHLPEKFSFGNWEAVRPEPYKEYRESKTPTLGYTIPASVPSEDSTLVDSMGPLCDRENENLAQSDKIIRILRSIYLKAIQTVEEGRDPPGVFRKPSAVVSISAFERFVTAKERQALA